MKLSKVLAVILIFALCLSMGLPVLASDTPDTSMGGQAVSAPPDNSTRALDILGHRTVLYYEYYPDEDDYILTFIPAYKDSMTRQGDLLIPDQGELFQAEGLDIRVDEIRWVEEDEIGTSGAVINCLEDDGTPFLYGGDESYYEAPDGKEYNSVLVLARGANEEEHTDAIETASGVGIAFNGSELEIRNTYVSVTGTGRPCVLVPSPSRDKTNVTQYGKLVCADSTFVCSDNRALLLMGGDVWFLNSTVTTDYWGALSFDNTSATMYVVNSSVNNTGGGYGIYTAAGCEVQLYGTRVTAAENGVMVCRDGIFTADALSAATEEATELYNGAADLAETVGSVVEDTEGRTLIAGDGSAICIHADMAGADTQAQVTLNGVILSTLDEDVVFEGDSVYKEFSYGDSSAAATLRRQDLSGACILMKSHSGKVVMEACELRSATGVLVRTAYVYDSMASGIYPTDGTEYIGDEVVLADMSAEGDILHEDYMRKMTLSLQNSELTGDVVSGTRASWNAKWSDTAALQAALEELGEDASEVDETELTAAFVRDEAYESFWGVRMTMDSSSVWTVTDESSLASLEIAEGAQLKAPEGMVLKIYADVPMSGDTAVFDVTAGTLVEELQPGVVYENVVLRAEEPAQPVIDSADGSMDLTINGNPVGEFTVNPETEEGTYTMNLGGLLGMFGIEVSYDEENGAISLTDESGILSGLIDASKDE